MKFAYAFGCFAVALGAATFVGCDAEPTKKAGSGQAAHDDHDHEHGDHDHDHGASKGSTKKEDAHDHHSHELGPNGGHVEHFREDESVHFEWAHQDDEQRIEIHLEEAVSKGAKIESVKIDVKLGDQTKSYTLDADEKAKIAGSVFAIKSGELMTALGASGTDEKSVTSTLVVKIDGKDLTCLLQHDHDHGHKH